MNGLMLVLWIKYSTKNATVLKIEFWYNGNISEK
jgi:hypothetical protein